MASHSSRHAAGTVLEFGGVLATLVQRLPSVAIRITSAVRLVQSMIFDRPHHWRLPTRGHREFADGRLISASGFVLRPGVDDVGAC